MRNSGSKNDIDRAKEIYPEIMNDGTDVEIFIDEETEKKLMEVIHHIK